MIMIIDYRLMLTYFASLLIDSNPYSASNLKRSDRFVLNRISIENHNNKDKVDGSARQRMSTSPKPYQNKGVKAISNFQRTDQFHLQRKQYAVNDKKLLYLQRSQLEQIKPLDMEKVFKDTQTNYKYFTTHKSTLLSGHSHIINQFKDDQITAYDEMVASRNREQKKRDLSLQQGLQTSINTNK